MIVLSTRKQNCDTYMYTSHVMRWKRVYLPEINVSVRAETQKFFMVKWRKDR